MSALKQNMMVLFLLGFAAIALAQYPAPYSVDADTLHLYHFDEDGRDEVTDNPVDLVLLGGAVKTEFSAAGYAAALNTYDGTSGAGPIAGAEKPALLTVSDFVGDDGAFTFEAIIKPNVALGALPGHMQIICGEGNDDRGWQFRINTSGQLQFYNLTQINSGGWDSVASIPTTGDQAYGVGAWFHVAVTYNGQENTANNLKFYWTRLGSGAAQTQSLASFTLEYDLSPSNPARFSVGNEYRNEEYTENFEGLIDEVRISSIARSPSEMLYSPDSDTLHYYHFEGGGDDSVRTNPIDLTLSSGASATEPSASGKGAALDVYDGISGDGPCAVATENPVAVSNFVGTDGAFTFEALIRPDIELGSQLSHMQIISMDSDNSTAARGWHFRVNSSSQLQFTTITGTIHDFTVALPTTGIHAWQAGQWYHVAAVYNGIQGSEDNLKLYWTKLDSDVAQAQLLGTFQMPSDLDSAVVSNFCIGNERRPTGGFSENFEGLIDAVRISRIAREASDLSYKLNNELPVIIEPLESRIVQANETVVFTTTFTSITQPQVSWYKSSEPDDIELQNSDPGILTELTYDSNTQIYTASLSIENCAISDSGRYFARITNLSERLLSTNDVILGVKGLRAHWTLDQADFNGTHYLDIVAGNDAMVISLPTFVTGADGRENGAVKITPDSGGAWLQGFDPAYFTGQFTLSYWANWQQSDVSADDFLADSGNGAVISVENGLIADQNWQHICAVFDGSVGKMYLDGIIVAECEWPLFQDMTSSFHIGSAESGEESFNGYLDDVRVFSYALDDWDVAQMRYDFTGLRSCLYMYSDQCDWSGPDGNPDCVVDVYDLAAFAVAYLSMNSMYDLTGPADLPDGKVDLLDFAELCAAWLDNGLYPEAN